MKKILNISLIISVLFASCSKEKSFEGSNTIPGPVNPGDSLLAKMVIGGAQSGFSDSIVYQYGYDASRRLINVNYSDNTQGSLYSEQNRFVRDSKGIVLQYIFKSDSLSANGLDSLVYNMNYNNSSSHYNFALASFSISGYNVRDSMVFSYDGSGRINVKEEFYDAGSGYISQNKVMYSYDGSNNLVDEQQYSTDSNGIYVLLRETQYQYDLKVNPLKLGIEGYLMNEETSVSQNNIISSTLTDNSNPANNNNSTFTLTYNPQNKPVSEAVSDTLGDNYSAYFYYE